MKRPSQQFSQRAKFRRGVARLSAGDGMERADRRDDPIQVGGQGALRRHPGPARSLHSRRRHSHPAAREIGSGSMDREWKTVPYNERPSASQYGDYGRDVWKTQKSENPIVERAYEERAPI